MKKIKRAAPREPRMKAPSTFEINNFHCCKLCIEELPEGESPESYADYLVGATPWGIQIWCKRHNCNVIHYDFAGQKFGANISREPDFCCPECEAKYMAEAEAAETETLH